MAGSTKRTAPSEGLRQAIVRVASKSCTSQRPREVTRKVNTWDARAGSGHHHCWDAWDAGVIASGPAKTSKSAPNAAWWSHRHPNVRQEPARQDQAPLVLSEGWSSYQGGCTSYFHSAATPPSGKAPRQRVCILRQKALHLHPILHACGAAGVPSICLPQHSTFMHEPRIIRESAREYCTCSKTETKEEESHKVSAAIRSQEPPTEGEAISCITQG